MVSQHGVRVASEHLYVVCVARGLGHRIAEKLDISPYTLDPIERIRDVPGDDEDDEFLTDRPAAGRRPDESVTGRPHRRHLGVMHRQ